MEGDVGGECFVGSNQKVRYEKKVYIVVPTNRRVARPTDQQTDRQKQLIESLIHD